MEVEFEKSRLKAGDFPGGAVVKNPPANAGGPGSIPGQGIKIQHAAWRGQKKKKKSCHYTNSTSREASVK